MLDNEQLKLVGDKWEKIWEFDNGNDKNKQQQKTQANTWIWFAFSCCIENEEEKKQIQ